MLDTDPSLLREIESTLQSLNTSQPDINLKKSELSSYIAYGAHPDHLGVDARIKKFIFFSNCKGTLKYSTISMDFHLLDFNGHSESFSELFEAYIEQVSLAFFIISDESFEHSRLSYVVRKLLDGKCLDQGIK
jgi:hypothetical protein